MTLTYAKTIAREAGLTILTDKNGSFNLAEARYICMSAASARRVSSSEWRKTCYSIAGGF